MAKPGDVLFYKDFVFSNGERHDKWFVVLNDTATHGVTLLLKTTSQVKRYGGAAQGCNKAPVVFYAPCSWQTCFKLDTYIQIPKIFPVTNQEITRLSKVNYVQPRGTLTSDCLAQLKACMAGHKDDIAVAHWSLIYK